MEKSFVLKKQKDHVVVRTRVGVALILFFLLSSRVDLFVYLRNYLPTTTESVLLGEKTIKRREA